MSSHPESQTTESKLALKPQAFPSLSGTLPPSRPHLDFLKQIYFVFQWWVGGQGRKGNVQTQLSAGAHGGWKKWLDHPEQVL